MNLHTSRFKLLGQECRGFIDGFGVIVFPSSDGIPVASGNDATFRIGVTRFSVTTSVKCDFFDPVQPASVWQESAASLTSSQARRRTLMLAPFGESKSVRLGIFYSLLAHRQLKFLMNDFQELVANLHCLFVLGWCKLYSFPHIGDVFYNNVE